MVQPPIVPLSAVRAPAEETLKGAEEGVVFPIQNLSEPLLAIPVAPVSEVKSVGPIIQPPIDPPFAEILPLTSNEDPSQVKPAECPIFPTLILGVPESSPI